MKKIILCTMLMAMAATTFCQETNPTKPVTRADYLQKSKNQKTAAWILLGGGVALIGSGFLIGDRKEASFDDAGTGVVMGGIGLLATIGSIPLFIASSKKKKKAMSLSFKNETIPQIYKSNFVYHYIPSLTLKAEL
jgi:hypothetical protein